MDSEMLNPGLYNLLYLMFDGQVEVANLGSPGKLTYSRYKDKYYARVGGPSQEFRVNCPMCKDTRGRLFINHYAVSNLRYKGRRVKTYHLFHCHNEDCRNVDLYEKLRDQYTDSETLEIPDRPKFEAGPDMALPLKCLPINAPRAPKAPGVYLESRGFDLNELANTFHVKACEVLPDAPYLGQVSVFPCYDGSNLSLWQARISYDVPKGSRTPKYYFPPGSDKSSVVYNRFNAMHEKMVVITEGVLDAIRVGPSGLALFGKVPSAIQTRIISRVFRRKMGVLMLDPDAEKEAVKWYTKYRTGLFDKGLFLCRLEDKDPAEHSREELWDKIVESIK